MLFLVELLDAIWSLYLVLVAGPRAVLRWIRRLSRPTATELAVSTKPEMQGFRRDTWLFAAGWLALSFVFGIAGGSLWYAVAVAAMGLMIIPGQIERRYDRLVVELSAPTTP